MHAYPRIFSAQIFHRKAVKHVYRLRQRPRSRLAQLSSAIHRTTHHLPTSNLRVLLKLLHLGDRTGFWASELMAHALPSCVPTEDQQQRGSPPQTSAWCATAHISLCVQRAMHGETRLSRQRSNSRGLGNTGVGRITNKIPLWSLCNYTIVTPKTLF